MYYPLALSVCNRNGIQKGTFNTYIEIGCSSATPKQVEICYNHGQITNGSFLRTIAPWRKPLDDKKRAPASRGETKKAGARPQPARKCQPPICKEQTSGGGDGYTMSIAAPP